MYSYNYIKQIYILKILSKVLYLYQLQQEQLQHQLNNSWSKSKLLLKSNSRQRSRCDCHCSGAHCCESWLSAACHLDPWALSAWPSSSKGTWWPRGSWHFQASVCCLWYSRIKRVTWKRLEIKQDFP